MKGFILSALALLTIITTLGLCKAAGKADKTLEHPERIWLRK